MYCICIHIMYTYTHNIYARIRTSYRLSQCLCNSLDSDIIMCRPYTARGDDNVILLTHASDFSGDVVDVILMLHMYTMVIIIIVMLV